MIFDPFGKVIQLAHDVAGCREKKIALRLPAELVERIDDWNKRWAKSALGVRLSRNTALVMLLERGLGAEKKGGPR
jgi:hypothetical protein